MCCAFTCAMMESPCALLASLSICLFTTMPALRFGVHAASLVVIGIIVNIALTLALVIKPFSESYAWSLACNTA